VVAFQRWVCHEVIPAIMDTGRYEVPNQTSTAIVLAPEQLIQLVEQLAEPVARAAAEKLSTSFFAQAVQLAASLKGSDETLASLLTLSVESHLQTEKLMMGASKDMQQAAQAMKECVETVQRAAQSCEGIYGMLDSLKKEIESLASNKRHLIDSLGRQITRIENI
jgi:hypothetical protein